MTPFWDRLWAAFDRCLPSRPTFAAYQVTPRQGRHTVRRRLLRTLQRRMARAVRAA